MTLFIFQLTSTQTAPKPNGYNAGTAGVCMIGGQIIYTNPNWFKPTKIVSSLTGNYAKKVWMQTAVGGVANTLTNTMINRKSTNTPNY